MKALSRLLLHPQQLYSREMAMNSGIEVHRLKHLCLDQEYLPLIPNSLKLSSLVLLHSVVICTIWLAARNRDGSHLNAVSWAETISPLQSHIELTTRDLVVPTPRLSLTKRACLVSAIDPEYVGLPDRF